MIPIAKTVFGPEEAALVAEVLASGWVAQGPMVERFERAFAARLGCRHAIAVTSCTAGLHILAVAMGIKPGDEVLVPAFTWVATANAIELVGGRPVFVDIDPRTFNGDPQRFAAAVTPRTVGMIPVHLFGLCADMTALLALARQHGLWVIEDAACALGSTHAGAQAGTMGEAACFSFHPRKSITTGEGGMITTDSDRIAALCRSLRNHGAEPGAAGALMLDYPRPGFNYRLTDLQAALGVAQLAKLDGFLAERERIAATYDRLLAGIPGLTLPQAVEGCRHTYQSYVCLLDAADAAVQTGPERGSVRDRLIQALAADGIATRPGTHAPALLTHYRTQYGLLPKDFPGTCRADGMSIALPVFPGLENQAIQQVVDSLHRHLTISTRTS